MSYFTALSFWSLIDLQDLTGIIRITAMQAEQTAPTCGLLGTDIYNQEWPGQTSPTSWNSVQ